MASTDYASTTPSRVIDIDPNVLGAACAFGGILFQPIVGSLGALLFLAAGTFLMARRPITAARTLYRHWYVLLLPAYCLISAVWSDYPSVTFRAALQIVLSFVIIVGVLRLIRPESFLRIFFLLYCVIAVCSILFGHVRGDTGAWDGVYLSKNFFSANMLVFWLAALALALDRHTPRLYRLAGLMAAPVAVVLIVLSQSKGALVVLPPATLVLVTGMYLRRFSGMKRVAFLGFMSLLAIGCIVLIYVFWDALFEALLLYSGKDVTLTGRTFIWETGLNVIAERPFLGVGFAAFWVHGNPLAELLWFEFGIPERAGFNFHNMHIHHAVEVGLIGLAMHVGLMFAALGISIVRALARPRADNVFFVAFMAQLVIYSLVEVPGYYQFHGNTIIGIAALIYGLQGPPQTPPPAKPMFTHRSRASA